ADGLTTKVIIETALLTDEEKVTACELIQEAGADFVKTATGFNGGGATVEDVNLLRKTVGTDFGVKEAGGGETVNDEVNMGEAVDNRIGASSAIAIITGGTSTESY